MAILLGAGNLGEILQKVADRPLPDFASETAAAAAPMPTLAANQKAVLVTVTEGNNTTTYQKTAAGVKPFIQS